MLIYVTYLIRTPNSVKTIKAEIDEIQTSKGITNLQKVIRASHDAVSEQTPPVIPIAHSGRGIQPPFNIRIQFNNKTNLIKETIPLTKIKGTAIKNQLIDSEFKPFREFVNKRFRKVWKWIHNNPNNDEHVIFPSNIVLAKITDEDYYVVKGLRRIIALKHSNFKTLSVLVIDYRDVYNKILDRRKRIEEQKRQNKNEILDSNRNFKPVKPRIRPTPIIKGQKRK